MQGLDPDFPLFSSKERRELVLWILNPELTILRFDRILLTHNFIQLEEVSLEFQLQTFILGIFIFEFI